nr:MULTISPECIES: iron-containing alcohol dehydrogenase [unclassified Nonomuraea]
MDEPLTNLDAELRADMRTEVKHLQGELGTTMVYVTHDQVEAMSLGHRIAILNEGRVEQIGTPLEVCDRPASLFCAAFIGSPPMNLIEVEVADGKLRSQGGLAFTPPPGLPRDRRLVAGVRPEALDVTEPGAERSVPAHSGIDAFCHAVESYAARPRAHGPRDPVQQVFLGRNPITDHYALLAAGRIARSLPHVVRDGGDKDARADMSYGSMLAGLAFSHAGNAAPHALQYPIGAATHTPHGLGVGLLLPHALDAARDAIGDRLAILAGVCGLDVTDASDAEAADASMRPPVGNSVGAACAWTRRSTAVGTSRGKCAARPDAASGSGAAGSLPPSRPTTRAATRSSPIRTVGRVPGYTVAALLVGDAAGTAAQHPRRLRRSHTAASDPVSGTDRAGPADRPDGGSPGRARRRRGLDRVSL